MVAAHLHGRRKMKGVPAAEREDSAGSPLDPRDQRLVVQTRNELMRIGTSPWSPSTMRTSCGAPPLRSGMKSITLATPLSVSKSVSRIGMPSRYRRETRRTGTDGHSSHLPCSSLPSRAAKHAAESVRGRQSQATDPFRPTSGGTEVPDHRVVFDLHLLLLRLALARGRRPDLTRPFPDPVAPVRVSPSSVVLARQRSRVWRSSPARFQPVSGARTRSRSHWSGAGRGSAATPARIISSCP